MANMIKFYRGLANTLPATGENGALYITTDEGAIYYGTGTGMKRLGDFVQVDNVASLPEKAHESCLYYCVAENILAKWNGAEWKQINKQPTAEELKGLLGLGSLAYKSEVAEADLNAALKEKVNAAAEGNHSHSNKALLDTYTQTEENLADAVSKKHAHANADELAKIAAGDKEKWDAVAADYLDSDDMATIEAEFEKVVYAETGKSLIEDTKIAKLDGISEGANKVEKSDTNGNIKVDGAEVVVYTHPEKHTTLEISDFDSAVKAYDYATKDEAQGYADAKVASVTAGDASVTIGGTATAPTVAAKLSADADNALELAEDGLKVVIPAAAEYSIVKAADSGDYAAVYNLTKDGTIVGASINIPKDIVVKSGSVVGDEIILVLNDEANTEIKIAVGSLIEYVTSGSEAGDMVVIAVDETTHKVTATITDGTITAAKLTTELQTAIGKAHSHDNADVLAGISADKVAAWDAAEKNAKDYADGLADNYAAADHDHVAAEITDFATEVAKVKVDAAGKADEATKATQDGNGKVIADTYAEKADSLAGYGIGDAYTKTEVEALLTWGEF